MKPRLKIKPIVLHSLVWASMMIASALLNGDGGNADQMIIFMIGGWFITQQLLINASAEKGQSQSPDCR